MPTNEIAVTVDESAVVNEVTVQPDWRKRMRPHELGPALLTAANTAITTRCEEHWRTFDVDAAARAAAATVPRAAPSAHGDPDSPVARALTEEILDLIDKARREQDDLLEQRASAAAETRASGPGGRVTVSAANGLITAVEVDLPWANVARYTEIGSEAAGAFQSVQRVAPPLGAPTSDLPVAMARLRELTADPVALVRQLGLMY